MGAVTSWKTMMAVTHDSDDVEGMLDSLVNKGIITSWRGGTGTMLRRQSGDAVAECMLGDLDVRPSDEEREKAERFWHGAIEGDGSMSELLLSVMRMDDAKRESYLRRYKTIERYVEEICSVHADAILLPDGTFSSNDGLRGRNQLHDWNVGFSGRFVAPLMSPRDDSPNQSPLMVRMFEYQAKTRR